jgi:hypothetical protein
MSPDALRDLLHKRPFEPFRIVQTDGTGFDVRHPELLMVGIRQAIVGLPAKLKPMLYDRAVTLDLLHIIRVEPLSTETDTTSKNGPGAP